MKIAVLLAAYNGMEWIDEQINSILNQRSVDVDIYISVDKSTDDTVLFCEKLSEKFHNIFMLPYGDIYGGAAKNFYRLVKDVNFSDYSYVSFSDQDDLWNDNKLFVAINKLQSESADGYSSNVMAFWQDGRKRLINKSQPQVEYDHFFESPGPGCTFVFSKALAMKFQKFLIENSNVENIEYHDWFLYAFARSFGYKWLIDDFVSMQYRQHNNNQIGANNSWKAIVKRIGMMRNGWYMHQVDQITTILGKNEQPFFKHCLGKGYASNIYLAFNIRKTRRKVRDQCVLFIMAIFSLI